MIEILAICCFALAGLFGIHRLLRGPDLGDRIIALDVTLMSLMGGIAVAAAITGDETHLVALAVISIVGFTATIAGARFIERQAVEPVGSAQPGERSRSGRD